ncbi:hypothetical protein MJO28_012783 [Puccinia striiformis f. sp. tritici]|uniref:GDP/GTP exchange factor Sec2 N-terminal domain-containing protein n=3 Tax=Puccinia striiformis TaxID=27350 RepID=A0A0L0VM78_9BASI|nr:hypothetical protein Pst134EA_024722 [Puccinia striiformis f. sp. tritici]KAI9631435.1 hypothetical protein KEM48_014410 [Puccinia striiformis f. sp. tritici PST-130]KNF00361.1 hypothetical protein PSTG_06291 [Puccinia striiformis f. sp. tritici PST-78]POW02486.1 hypothetical protein PSTT_11713 [Puccinia striiformis]KAH9445132.1 hypothetical protein Pst134EB_025381 [Puccinia striiformis f. sp. tritici]KAH9453857.1 hypothetical protein Pst134EA_024722 [Puccinia striiformis f. sp. tritici]
MTTISTRTLQTPTVAATTTTTTINNLQSTGCSINSYNSSSHSSSSSSSASPSPSSSSSATIIDPSSHLHPSNIPPSMLQTQPDPKFHSSEFIEQLAQLNQKLVKSFETISNLEDELHETKAKNHKLTARNTALELESAQHNEAIKGSVLIERANVQMELYRLTQKVTQESEKRSQSEASLNTIHKELDDLSVSLFTEANRLVAAEKIQRIQAERKVKEVEEAMKRVEEVIEARRDQSNELRLSLEEAERERDQYKVESETLRNQLNSLQSDPSTAPSNPTATSSIDSLAKTSSSDSIVNSKESLATPSLNYPASFTHSDSPRYSPCVSTLGVSGLQTNAQMKLSHEILPFTEFLQFVHYLRRTREDTLARALQAPGLTESYYSAAAAITSIGSATPTSMRPPTSSSSASFPPLKDLAPTPSPKDPLGPVLPLSQHLSQPFVKRCLDEDSDPALRLDLAPGLNFMSRRATLTALLEGNLVIEPVWSESGQASGFENCTLCGCSLDPWLSTRELSAGSSNHIDENSTTTGSTMRKMLRGGGWGFGGIVKPKRSSHPVTSTQQLQKSTLAPSVSLKLPNSGRSTPSIDENGSLHIHTFKTVDGSSTRYPICPTYCLSRLRAVCHFWTFVRSLERGILLDESFWFSHYIHHPSTSSRFTETQSLGLAYDHALKRIRGQSRSRDSVINGSSPLTHSIPSPVSITESTFRSSSNQNDVPPVVSEAAQELGMDEPQSSAKKSEVTEEVSGQNDVPLVASEAAQDPNLDASQPSSKESEDAGEAIASSEKDLPALERPQTPDPVHIPQSSPSPSPTSTTGVDVAEEVVEVNDNHSDDTDACGTSLEVRSPTLSNQVPILSPAPSPNLRRSLARSVSQTLNNIPSILSKGRSTHEGGSESNMSTPVATDPNQARGKQDMLPSSPDHTERKPVDGVTPLRNSSRSAQISSLANSRNQPTPSHLKSQSNLELMEAGWEEKCWQQVIKLKEEMFFKRVGLSLIPN